MSSKLKTSAASLALIAMLGAGLVSAQTTWAQEAPAATTEQGTAAETAPAVALPEILQGDAFSGVTSRPGPRGGLMVEGTIAETGKSFDALVSPDGQLRGIRTAEGSSLPQAVVDALLPEAVRGHAVLSEITELNAIGTRDGAVMASGQDASGDEVRIGFDADGALMHFDRGDRGERGGPWMGGDRGGPWKGGDRDHDMKGDHGDHGKKGPRERDGDHGRKGPRDGDHGDRAERGPRPGMPGAPGDLPPPDGAAIGAALDAAGYTELGAPRPGPEGIVIEALNPQGEPVVVVVTPAGEVVRETAR